MKHNLIFTVIKGQTCLRRYAFVVVPSPLRRATSLEENESLSLPDLSSPSNGLGIGVTIIYVRGFVAPENTRRKTN